MAARIPSTSSSAGIAWGTIVCFLLMYVFSVGLLQWVLWVYFDKHAEQVPLVKTAEEHFIFSFFTLLAALFSVWLFQTKINGQPFLRLRVGPSSAGKELCIGLLLGGGIMAAGFLLLYYTDKLLVYGYAFNAADFVLSIGAFLFVALGEELLFRGYIQSKLMEVHRRYVALIISAVMFSAMHSLNPNISYLGLVGLLLFGLMAGLPYLYTRSLWFPVALHFSWNFFQATVFGFKVSGSSRYSLIKQEVVGHQGWTGGSFGLEASVPVLLLQVLALGLLFFIFSNRPVFTFWKVPGGKDF